MQSPAELASYKQFSMCINCMLCYAAPARSTVWSQTSSAQRAIALAQRYNLDSRDQGQDARREVISKHEGVWECTFVSECSVVCLQARGSGWCDPAGKASGAIDWFKSMLLPRGSQ